MKLWEVRKRADIPAHSDRWSYDCSYGFVIRAEDEDAARLLASKEHGDEGAAVWLDGTKTECVELTAEGKAEVILRDFLAG